MKTTDQTTGTETTTTTEGTMNTTTCNCGCGLPTKRAEARYLPGHDAKHVGKQVAQFVGLVGDDVEGAWHGIEAARDLHIRLMNQLPTDALQVKFNRAIANKLERDFDRWATRENRADAIKDEARREAAHKANTIWFGWHPDDYAASFKG